MEQTRVPAASARPGGGPTGRTGPAQICRAGRLPRLLTAAALLAAAGPALAADPVPQYAAQIHLGVASCAGSTCHGSVEPWQGSRVLQNEYVTWSSKDDHAKAYEVLLNDRSKRIARNLGISAAERDNLCLDCHTDNVPADRRGRQFQLTDGVGCESCHGGAERWLGPHVSAAFTRADFINMGMIRTEDPRQRAELCLSCHYGDDRKFVTHRLMGAGHPRLSFELDTFTTIQPSHYVIDDDYRKRKQVASGVQVWAVGQAMALSKGLAAIADPKRNGQGLFPELVLFDCQACHHNLKDLRWQPRASTGLEPGQVRLNDANLVILRIIVGQVAPNLADRLNSEGKALHQASTRGLPELVLAAKRLQQTVGEITTRLEQHDFGPADLKGLWTGLMRGAQTADFMDYAAAEQATMAVGAIAETMHRAGLLNDTAFRQITGVVDRLQRAVFDQYEYKPEAFRAAIRELANIQTTAAR